MRFKCLSIHVAFVLLLVFGCDEATDPPDAGAPADSGDPTMCASAVDCSDGVFCNGAEICDPAHPSADADGCIAGTEPCLAGQSCSETDARCLSDCASDSDADGDGSIAVECGGDDCDDSRADRFPGNSEVCDIEGIDEDCDPSTLGPDGDGDGIVSTSCCNAIRGELRCGADCDDTLMSVNPGGTEVCNGIDEDCDGSLDEGVLAIQYPDIDGDGFGNARAGRERECDGDPLFTDQIGDCDDTNPDVSPIAPEVCDGVDNDCDGEAGDEIDIDRDGFLDAASTCTGASSFDCDDLNPLAFPGAPEQCNDVDDNCDGTTDERVVVGGGVGADAFCASRLGDGVGFCADLGSRRGCALSTCPRDRGNCDDNPANGCEVDFLTDNLHCGGCGFRCPGTCVAGLCDPAPTGTVVDIAMGYEGGCFIREEGLGGQGGLWCWSEIIFVPFGNRPIPIRDATGARIIDAVEVAGKRNDLFWLQAGTGTLFEASLDAMPGVAGPVPGWPSSLVGLAAGSFGVCALTSTGELYCEDDISAGIENRFAGERFLEVSVGERHACAIRLDNLAICWGFNSSGQLGLTPDGGSHPREEIPPGIGAYGSIRAGSFHTCTERLTGELTCWGQDSRFPGVVFPSTPYTALLGPITDFAAGNEQSCAIQAGRVLCWGDEPLGSGAGLPCEDELEDPTAGFSSCDDLAAPGLDLICDTSFMCTPTDTDAREVRVATVDEPREGFARLNFLENVTQLAMTQRSICGVVADREVYCWGQSGDSEIATDESVAVLRVATPQRSASRLADAALGRNFGCARRHDGTIRCWGQQENGRMGDLADRSYLSPQDVNLGVDSARQIALGRDVGCVVLSSGAIACWGGTGGDPTVVIPLGDGSTFNVGSLTAVNVSSITQAREVSVAVEHACALVGDGEVWCWGSNADGQLGNPAGATDDCGGTSCALTPIQVMLPAAASQVLTAGFPIGDDGGSVSVGSSTCARLVDGRVFCWGRNEFGALGLGSTFEVDVPTRVGASLIDETIDIATGTTHSCALQASGVAFCWGADLDGISGPAEVCAFGLPCVTTPVQVPILADGRRIHVALGQTCAERPGGVVTCWGVANAGDGTSTARPIPSSVVALPAAARGVHMGWETECVSLVTDELFCWDEDRAGERGDGIQHVGVSVANPILPQSIPSL